MLGVTAPADDEGPILPPNASTRASRNDRGSHAESQNRRVDPEQQLPRELGDYKEGHGAGYLQVEENA